MRIVVGLLACAVLSVALVVGALAPGDLAAQAAREVQPVIVLHGGAGTINRGDMSDEVEQAYRDALGEALRTGYAVLESGGASLDAVVAAIQVMEASPLFNAAKGAVFTNAKTVELDASIMEGATRNAGAVAGVKRIKSPILAARAVMEQSPHVMLAGDGADTFAEEQGLEMVANDYFYTARRLRQIERRLEQEEGPSGGDGVDPVVEADEQQAPLIKKFGTVGAVALDREGHLAAGTSTGGMTNKRWGRIGDSPVIGAGTYADDATCAVSATGHGEYFIRAAIAHDISAIMRYAGLDLVPAASAVIHGTLTEMGGTGGVIALDAEGNIAMPFNTDGMYRGYIDRDGEMVVQIYRD